MFIVFTKFRFLFSIIRIVFIENALLYEGESIIYLNNFFDHVWRMLNMYSYIFDTRSFLVILEYVIWRKQI